MADSIPKDKSSSNNAPTQTASGSRTPPRASTPAAPAPTFARDELVGLQKLPVEILHEVVTQVLAQPEDKRIDLKSLNSLSKADPRFQDVIASNKAVRLLIQKTLKQEAEKFVRSNEYEISEYLRELLATSHVVDINLTTNPFAQGSGRRTKSHDKVSSLLGHLGAPEELRIRGAVGVYCLFENLSAKVLASLVALDLHGTKLSTNDIVILRDKFIESQAGIERQGDTLPLRELRIDLSHCSFSPDGPLGEDPLDVIQLFPNLKTLEIFCTDLTPSYLAERLRILPRLTSLTLDETRWRKDSLQPIIDACGTKLESLHMRFLEQAPHDHVSPHTEEQAVNFSPLENLKTLDLSHTDVSAKWLLSSKIASLKKLKQLFVLHSKIASTSKDAELLRGAVPSLKVIDSMAPSARIDSYR